MPTMPRANADRAQAAASGQQCLFEAGRPSSDEPARRGRRTSHGSAGTQHVPAVAAALADICERLARVEQKLDELCDHAAHQQLVKQYYTTQEVARILDKRPYTVREWCRLERVNAHKVQCGRGIDNEWRISHEELLRIQNEGLLDSPYRRARGTPD